MARLAGLERVTVFEAVKARNRSLERELEDGQRLRIHLIDDAIRGPRDPDGSLHFDVNEIAPGTFHGVNILI